MPEFPEFEDLPFNDRPDLTPYLIHLTRSNSDNNFSAYENLVSILLTGEIWGSGKEGYIKGPNKAACFMDVPFSALKYVLKPENNKSKNLRYEPYGIFLSKERAYEKGCRPVLYLSEKETYELCIPDSELWRVVRFEVQDKSWISWLHEREWRCKGDFSMPEYIPGVLVKTPHEAFKLQKSIHKHREEFKTIPASILPLEIVCQGLQNSLT